MNSVNTNCNISLYLNETERKEEKAKSSKIFDSSLAEEVKTNLNCISTSLILMTIAISNDVMTTDN